MEKIYRFHKIISSYGKMHQYPQTLRFQIIEKHLDFIKLHRHPPQSENETKNIQNCAGTPKCYTTPSPDSLKYK